MTAVRRSSRRTSSGKELAPSEFLSICLNLIDFGFLYCSWFCWIRVSWGFVIVPVTVFWVYVCVDLTWNMVCSCGAMTHDSKTCMDRPRKTGAKFTNKFISPDEKIETFELDYDGKRDRWNGYDPSTYSRVIDTYEARDEARRKHQKEEQLKRLEQKNSNPEMDQDKDSDEDEDEDEDKDGGEVDEAKVDESQQMDFAKVEKRVRTTGGGSTGTVR